MVFHWVYSLPKSSRTWHQICSYCHLTNHSKPTLIKEELQGSECFRAQRTFLPLLRSLGKLPSIRVSLKQLLPDPRTNCSQKFCSLSGGNCSPDLARILPSPFKEQLLFLCGDPGSPFTQGHPFFLERLDCPRVSVLFLPLSGFYLDLWISHLPNISDFNV